ncbi:MAG: polyprenyl synthetase family protein [Legionellales bacterium]
MLLLLDTYLQGHEQFLEHILNKTNIPAEPLRAAIHYSLIPGGKRIRPVLVYLMGDLLEVPVEVLDVIAAAIELTHGYSLIHDDLPAMDNDDLRRGKPSCHKAFDEATAILAGDGLQALAIEVLMTRLTPLIGASLVIHCTLALVKASGVSGMVSGQSLDLSELAKPSISEKQLTEIHHLKTGKLILACAEMVIATQPSAPQPECEALRTYAKHLGLVFQIQDDYLDCYASTQLMGKGRSSDSANNKTTFATLLSKNQLESYITEQYQLALEALRIFGDKSSALIQVTNTLRARSPY